MSALAVANLRRAWVYGISLILLCVLRVEDDVSRTLVVTEPVAPARLTRAELPLTFEPNLGQVNPLVKFLARGSGYTLFLTKDEAVFALRTAGGGSQKSGVRSQKRKDVRCPWSTVRCTKQVRGGAQAPAPSPQLVQYSA